MKKYFFAILFCATFVGAQNIQNGFPFNIPPFEITGSEFFPNFPSKAISTGDEVTIDANGKFSVRGTPIKFWGVNLVADGAFPDKGYADGIANRMQGLGINLVRFHHMDNPWAQGSFFYNTSSTRVLNQDNLDKFERIFAALKDHGIYSNINLNVSRTFRKSDGIADADSLSDYGKVVTLFDPQLIDLQKEFAQQLLTHQNKYTGTKLAEDPAVAMVEIANENSFFPSWTGGTLKPISQGGKLTSRHYNMLTTMWNDFLVNKYANNDSMSASWAGGQASGDNQITDSGFENGYLDNKWQLEQHETAKASASVTTNQSHSGTHSAKVSVTSVTGTNWHIQWKNVRNTIVEGDKYSVKFYARSSNPARITVTFMLDVNPWTSYQSESFDLGYQWKECMVSFVAPVTLAAKLRISFMVGEKAVDYYFDDITFGHSTVAALEAGEDLAQKNIRLVNYSESGIFTTQRVADQTEFFIKTQQNYFHEMMDYLRNTLGVKAPLSSTNWNFGVPDIAVQSVADYMDNHAYWDHPQFPTVPWSSTDWKINNTSMVKADSWNTILNLMNGTRVAGKPYTISEYNHAFPNRYQSEGVVFLASYSSLHDVDGIMFFDYNSSKYWMNEKIDGYFSIHQNPGMLSLIPSCGYAFRNGLIAESKKSIKIDYSPDDIYRAALNDPRKNSKKWAMVHKIESGDFKASATTDLTSYTNTPSTPYKSDTDEILWNPTAGYLTTITDKFIAATGFFQQNSNLSLGPLTIANSDQFASITWLSSEGQNLDAPGKSLLTVSTIAQNTNMTWDGNSTVHTKWGSAPAIMAPAMLNLRMNISADSILVYPLLASGEKSGTVHTFYPSSGSVDILIDQNSDSTAWFGIEIFGNATGVSSSKNELLPDKLYQNYPNPANPSTTIEFSLSSESNVEIDLFNMLGERIKKLEAGVFTAGVHKLNVNLEDVSSGVYFYRIRAGEFSDAKKLTVLK